MAGAQGVSVFQKNSEVVLLHFSMQNTTGINYKERKHNTF